MDDFNEQEDQTNNEVQIEDLGAPAKGVSLLLYTSGKKLRAAPYVRVLPAIFLLAASLLAIFFLPGSSLLHPAPPASYDVSSSSEQEGACSVVIIPTRVVSWHSHLSTPTIYGTVVTYSCSSIQIQINSLSPTTLDPGQIVTPQP